MNPNENAEIRLQLRLARSGLASRRKCEQFIAEGRVAVNGKIVIKPGTKVKQEDEVSFDGRVIREEKRRVYIAMHKPPGFLCSNKDPDGRPLLKSLLDIAVSERIFNVGRLDYMSSGLILFTNDGEFSRALTHPSNSIEKEYIVTAKDAISHDLMQRFHKGFCIDGVRYRASIAEVIASRTARIVLTEGKNREIRKVFLSDSITVKKVHRVRIGPILLKGLSPGRFRHLKQSEVQALLKICGKRRN